MNYNRINIDIGGNWPKGVHVGVQAIRFPKTIFPLKSLNYLEFWIRKCSIITSVIMSLTKSLRFKFCNRTKLYNGRLIPTASWKFHEGQFTRFKAAQNTE